jgi:hypothetical protein
MKATLYIDVDDTLIANCCKGSGFDMRPGALTQLRVLSRLFNCVWLTCWPRERIFELIRLLYGAKINKDLSYADWGHGHPQRKAGYVLDPKRDQNFWWLEDPLCREEMKALSEAGKLDRYVRVEPFGQWAFLDAVHELFRRTGMGNDDIKRVGGKPEWFDKEAILTENPCRENLRETLTLLKYLATSDALEPEARLREIQSYLFNQLNTLY